VLSASDHALRGLLDEVAGTLGPAGDVREAVIAAVQAEGVARDVRDRFDLDLGYLPTRDGSLGVQQRVTYFVDQRLDGLRSRYIGTYPDLLLRKSQ
jgi:hypothetical protein